MSETLEQEIRTLRAHFWSIRDPEGRAFAPLADAYLRKGDLDEAHSLVEDGLARLPDFTTGHLVAARVHRARGESAAAEEALERLLALDADHGSGIRLRGELAEAAGDRDAALAAFRRALELEPDYEDLEGRIARLSGEVPADSGFSAPEPSPDEDPFADVLDEGPTETTPSELDEDDPFRDVLGGTGSEPGRAEPDPDPPGPVVRHPAGDEPFGEILPDDDGSSDRATHPFEGFAGDAPGVAGEGGEDDLVFGAFSDDEGSALAPETGGPVESPALEDPSGEGPGEGGEAPGEPLVTRTLGELYVKQGLVERAIGVYEHLLRRDPGNAELAERLDDLRARIDGQESDAPALHEAGEGETGGWADEGDAGVDAPQWADARDDRPTGETPFAWVPDPGDEDEDTSGPAGVPGRPIARYFEDLLAWEPGAVPIESLAPEGEGDPPEGPPP